MELFSKIFSKFLYEPTALLLTPDKTSEIINKNNKALDVFDMDYPIGKNCTDEVGPYLIRQIAYFKTRHVKKALAWR